VDITNLDLNLFAVILTGFTDEAADSIDEQIRVTKRLGWQYLSARTIGSGNIHEIGEDEFEQVVEWLEASNIKVAEFGTLIGNWGKSITSDWTVTLDEINRCIPRMQRLDVKYARIMSYAQLPWGEDQREEERFRRLREITKRFKDAGLEALHENCMNWGGFSPDHTLRLLDEVPGLRLVFDTGNPVFAKDRSKAAPYPWQDSLEFFHKVKHAVAHVHVKDAVMHSSEEGAKPDYTFPGEGQGHVREILSELKQSGYDGFIAVEPHLAKVFHDDTDQSETANASDIYVEYGKRMERLIRDL
jgi:sugar phosphate isomerase/epimerase